MGRLSLARYCLLVVGLGMGSLGGAHPVSAQSASDYYASSDAPKAEAISGNHRWMAAVDSRRKLSELSLPGTHDSGALDGGILYKCQRWGISDQLRAGVRYLDIRGRRLKDGDFAIHHGRVFMNKMFAYRERIGESKLESPVLADVRGFLQANPSECIVMRLKSEYNAEAGAPSMADEFARIMARPENQGLFYTGSTIPKLGDARGKIVLLDNAGLEKGIKYGGPHCRIQDLYKVFVSGTDRDEGDNSASLPQKKRRIREEVDAANQPSEKLFINHCSGSVGLPPFAVAKAVNADVYGFLGGKPAPFTTGILIFDFPGEALLGRVIELNKR